MMDAKVEARLTGMKALPGLDLTPITVNQEVAKCWVMLRAPTRSNLCLSMMMRVMDVISSLRMDNGDGIKITQ